MLGTRYFTRPLRGHSAGWSQAVWTQDDPRFLELHHLEAHAAGGENIEQNLAVVCNKCHDAVHVGRRERELALLREEQCRMYSQ
jgi:5-methylcytosine-specific restriction endonuclease McrA